MEDPQPALDSNETSIVRLTEGLSINELLSDSGATFKVNFDDMKEEPDLLSYEPREVFEYTNSGCVGLADEDDYNDGEPFEKLAQKMTNVFENGKIKKRILREGYGTILPDKSHVSIHYNAYLEYSDEPFDSTYVRKRPFTFRLNEGQTLPGLDHSVQTMKVNEKSQFLVHPCYAYGVMGCLERVPPNSHVLFEIEVKNCVDSGASISYPHLGEEQQKDFAEIYKFTHALCSKANDQYSKGLFKLAIRDYNIAISKLETCQLGDYEDQEKQQQLLLRLYTNLAVAYTKLREPRRACINCNKVYNMCTGTGLKIPIKVYFNHSRSLMQLCDFEKAEEFLKKARSLEPQNLEITREFIKLDAKKKEDHDREVSLAKAIFRNTELIKEPREKTSITKEFQNSIMQYCQDLMNDEESTQYNLPDNLTKQELEFTEMEVAKHGLKLKCSKNGVQKYYIAKLYGMDK